MHTLKGFLIGAVTGFLFFVFFIVGGLYSCALGACFIHDDYINLIKDYIEASPRLAIFALTIITPTLICALIGFTMDMSDRRYNNKIKEEQRHKALISDIVSINETIYKSANTASSFMLSNNYCDNVKIFLQNNLKSPYYNELQSIYENYRNNHLQCIHSEMNRLKNKQELNCNGYNAMIYVCNHLHFYNLMSDNRYDNTVAQLRVYINKLRTRSYFIDENTYGKVNQSLYVPIIENSLQYQKAFSDAHSAFETFMNFHSPENFNCFNQLFFNNLIQSIYGLAFQKPFDVNKYLSAANMLETLCYTLYRSDNNRDTYFVSPLDCIFSKIIGYSRMGRGVLNQIKKEIDFWVDVVAGGKTSNNPSDLIILASGLMWLGEYELELEILRKTASLGIQLQPEVQERLAFLENGGSTGPELYSISNYNLFNYDYSALKWKDDDFSNFFKNLAFKNTQLNYALAVSEFRKTFKSKFNLSITYNMILDKMNCMAHEEYADEIYCKLLKINSLSEEFSDYEEAILIRPIPRIGIMHAGILLFYNKIGININIQILTLFIPMQNEDMQKNMRLAISLKQETSPKVAQTLDSIRASVARQIDELCGNNPHNNDSIY